MSVAPHIHAAVIGRTLRVPVAADAPGDGAAAARQVDIALMAVGFKCSPELLERLSAQDPGAVATAGRAALESARQLVGDHVEHNVYFRDFPKNVPDTADFWAQCVGDALLDHRSRDTIRQQLVRRTLNLLDLPKYGRYQHTFRDMQARHAGLVASAADRVTVLEAGGTLHAESLALLLQLAASPIPLHREDLALLGALARAHPDAVEPGDLSVRENRAMVNAARIGHGLEPGVDTVTDVLRLACAMSEGDVTLATSTRLRSFKRAERRSLLAALDTLVAEQPARLADVHRHTEPFKRLGERLHPHDYPRFAFAAEVFAVARGELAAQTLASKVEAALSTHDLDRAVALLSTAPGTLLRAVDHLARSGADPDSLLTATSQAAGTASLRVVLQLREHLLNRGAAEESRIFVNGEGHAWTTTDERPPLAPTFADALGRTLDATIVDRLAAHNGLVVIDPSARSVALPLTGKAKPAGLGLLPRGSQTPVESHVRFFIYWKQRRVRTDLDLSVLLLNGDFRRIGHISYTNLKGGGAVHSGDITEAPKGASEFIEINLTATEAQYVVPQVNVFSGEGFDDLDEAFFGYMERDPARLGEPYEPRTVRAKSDLSGTARVSLPLVFARGASGDWSARWMHLGLRGRPEFNEVENNRVSTSMLARSILERDYLTLGYLEALLRDRGATVVESIEGLDPGQPVTYLGSEPPAALPVGSAVITPATFWDLPT